MDQRFEELKSREIKSAKGWTMWSGTMAEADEYKRLLWLHSTPRLRREAVKRWRALFPRKKRDSGRDKERSETPSTDSHAGV